MYSVCQLYDCVVFFTAAGIRLEFAKPIKDVTVKERETAEFSVELSHDKISVVWYKNDVRLHPSKVVHMSDHGKIHTLAFKEVTIDDTSMIKVEAMDKSMTAMLTVIGQCHFESFFCSCKCVYFVSHVGFPPMLN